MLGTNRRIVGIRHPGVGFVDNPRSRVIHHCLDDLHAVDVDGGVVVGFVLTLPRRRVGNGGPFGRGESRVYLEVELRASDTNQVRLVEPGQGRLVTIDRRLSRDENFVVRLCLVAHHADLVALTVIDMDVNGALEGQRLKIRPAVVDVDHGSEVRPVEESHQVLILGHQDDPQWRCAEKCVECVHLTDDHDRRDIVVAFEDGKPLRELIELGRTVGEVQGDIGARQVCEVETSRLDLSEIPHPAGKTARGALALAAQPRVAG